MTDGDKWDSFRMGLKPQVRLEFMNSGKTTFEEGNKIVLNLHNALLVIGMVSCYNQKGFRITSCEGPVPMDIGNIQRNREYITSNRRPKSNQCLVCKIMVAVIGNIP